MKQLTKKEIADMAKKTSGRVKDMLAGLQQQEAVADKEEELREIIESAFLQCDDTNCEAMKRNLQLQLHPDKNRDQLEAMNFISGIIGEEFNAASSHSYEEKLSKIEEYIATNTIAKFILPWVSSRLPSLLRIVITPKYFFIKTYFMNKIESSVTEYIKSPQKSAEQQLLIQLYANLAEFIHTVANSLPESKEPIAKTLLAELEELHKQAQTTEKEIFIATAIKEITGIESHLNEYEKQYKHLDKENKLHEINLAPAHIKIGKSVVAIAKQALSTLNTKGHNVQEATDEAKKIHATLAFELETPPEILEFSATLVQIAEKIDTAKIANAALDSYENGKSAADIGREIADLSQKTNDIKEDLKKIQEELSAIDINADLWEFIKANKFKHNAEILKEECRQKKKELEDNQARIINKKLDKQAAEKLQVIPENKSRDEKIKIIKEALLQENYNDIMEQIATAEQYITPNKVYAISSILLFAVYAVVFSIYAIPMQTVLLGTIVLGGNIFTNAGFGIITAVIATPIAITLSKIKNRTEIHKLFDLLLLGTIFAAFVFFMPTIELMLLGKAIYTTAISYKLVFSLVATIASYNTINIILAMIRQKLSDTSFVIMAFVTDIIKELVFTFMLTPIGQPLLKIERLYNIIKGNIQPHEIEIIESISLIFAAIISLCVTSGALTHYTGIMLAPFIGSSIIYSAIFFIIYSIILPMLLWRIPNKEINLPCWHTRFITFIANIFNGTYDIINKYLDKSASIARVLDYIFSTVATISQNIFAAYREVVPAVPPKRSNIVSQICTPILQIFIDLIFLPIFLVLYPIYKIVDTITENTKAVGNEHFIKTIIFFAAITVLCSIFASPIQLFLLGHIVMAGTPAMSFSFGTMTSLFSIVVLSNAYVAINEIASYVAPVKSDETKPADAQKLSDGRPKDEILDNGDTAGKKAENNEASGTPEPVSDIIVDID